MTGGEAVSGKWLALHAFRTNTEIFKSQLKEFSEATGIKNIDFVQAPHPGRGDGMHGVRGFEWWSSPTFTNYIFGWVGDVGLDESVKYLEEYIAKNGPYDGVIGFSQGGAMANNIHAQGLVKKCILFSPVTPIGRTWPMQGKDQPIRPTALVFVDPVDPSLDATVLPHKHILIKHSEAHSVPTINASTLAQIKCWLLES